MVTCKEETTIYMNPQRENSQVILFHESTHRENFLATIVVEQDPRASQENDIRKNSKNFQSITQKPRGCPCAI